MSRNFPNVDKTEEERSGVLVQFGVQLEATTGALGAMTSALQQEAQWRQRKANAVRQIPLAPPQIPLSTGAGVLDIPDVLAAKTGYSWSVRRLAVTGWSAGSVEVFMNSQFGEPVAIFPTPNVLTYAKGALLQHPGDRMVFVATGITGFVQINGSADCFESWYLPHYLD
jgi:hypothetical protein